MVAGGWTALCFIAGQAINSRKTMPAKIRPLTLNDGIPGFFTIRLLF
jgi:hypothetical protein